MKRLRLLVLAFMLVFASFAPWFGQTAQASTGSVGNLTAFKMKESFLQQLEKLSDSDASYDANEKVRVVVELSSEPAIVTANKLGIKYADLEESKKEQLETAKLNEQDKVKEEIEEKGVEIEYITEFTTVFNGFSAEVTYKDISKIKKLKNVANVYVANEYELPDSSVEMKFSKELVEAQKAWEASGFKGEGMVIGIIDSGLDYTHKDMVLSDPEKAKLSKEDVEEIIEKNGLPGKYFTDKVPYGYNYFDQDEEVLDLNPETGMHGMHVAGTVGANGDDTNGGISGIAPEAQLLALKVFSNNPNLPTTFSDVYVKAIDDAIKLGADVLNMSLGSTAGFVSPEDPEQKAVAYAVENGVLMSISAGNSAYFGNGFYYPYTSNPDYGVVGSPGVSYESLQVASYENSYLETDALVYSIDGDETKAMFLSASDSHPDEYLQKTFEVVYAGIGETSDFKGKNLEGKYALVQRGLISFVDKALNAQNAGAAGVIIYNNTDGIVNMASDPSITIPQLFMLKVDGDRLAAALQNGQNVTVTFNGDKTSIVNTDAGKMSDFSSWGVTPNLDFKPEITAPGGDILSTVNNNQYAVMSGTSMAAPHVSGGAALVLERVDKEFSVGRTAERVQMAKNLLMNTAKVITFEGEYVSPRNQGAGLMQLNAALSTPVIVTDPTTNEGKVALKEVKGNTVTFQLTATNYSNTEVTYNVSANAQTDFPYNSIVAPGILPAFNLNNAAKVQLDGETVTSIQIPAQGSVTFDVTVDVSQYNSYLSSSFTNGYWLEGFVTLTDPTDTYPTLSVPYVGFKGEWDDAPVFDSPVWEPDSFYEITNLLSSMEDGYYFLGDDPEELYFSPNGDGIFDEVLPLVSFLRNAKQVTVSVLDENKNPLRTIRTDNYIRKNYYDGGRSSEYTLKPNWAWDGTVNGKVVEDGQYYLQLVGVIDYEGAEPDTLVLPIKVDATAPELTASFSKETNTVSYNVSDSGSGLAYVDIFVDGVSVFGENGFLTEEKMEYQLPKIVKDSQSLVIVAFDNVGNAAVQVLQEAVDTTPPVIDHYYPEAFEVYAENELFVFGSVYDQSEVVSVTVDGQEALIEYDPYDGVYYYYAVLEYDDGYYMLKIRATDEHGIASQIGIPIFVDSTAPELTVEGPQAVAANKDQVTVKWTLADNFDELRLYVNDSEVFANELSSPFGLKEFEKVGTLTLDLPAEENTFVFKAVDLAGNETTVEYTVVKVEDLVTIVEPEIEDGKATVNDEVFNKALEEAINTGASVVVDLGDETDVELALKEDQVKALIENGVPVQVSNEEVAVTVPASLLNEGTQATIVIDKKAAIEGSVSAVYDVKLYVDGKEVTEFEEPVTLVFAVDETKVSNPDNLKVFYYNEETGTWVEVEGAKAEYVDGKVIVTTNHFTVFTVFETEESGEIEAGAPTEEPGTEEPGTEEPGTEEPGTEEPGTEEPGTEEPGTEEPGTEEPGTEEPGTEEPGTEEPGTEEPGTEEPGTENPGKEDSGSEKTGDSKGEDNKGNSPADESTQKPGNGKTEGNNSDQTSEKGSSEDNLPKTATNNGNTLLIGMYLILASIGVYLINRKIRKAPLQ